MGNAENINSLYDVAIIGMVGRFPGADDLNQFWENLRNGVESITFFSDEELLEAGVDPDLLSDPNYVKANAIVSGVDRFDARFFGINPREATMMDPQQRVFLEYAELALESAGYDAERYDGRIGMYAGKSRSTYLLNNLYSSQSRVGTAGVFQVAISNDKDFLATQVSYRLNLQGPSFTVQTACSTSLVAVHLACQSLLNRECDMVMVGGISLGVPQIAGYLYQQGGIPSPDGHCRPFDARAQGTVGGNGVGIVVLKRLADALEDGDTIHAVIKGSAINNDGARKIGFTAPSEDGQMEVITEALAVADVGPETITYVEAHGTGTALGDPIEMAALTRVFRASTAAKGFCGLGSVKSNIGHLDAAAGVASLIKTVLALKHKQLPPSLHFTEPNPKIDLANSPFYVNAELQDWKTDGRPRRAGVSSFGIGGTNAHVVLEEAPPAPPTDPGRGEHLLVLSAKTEEALEKATANLAAHLRQHPEVNLADVTYTLQVGRRPFAHRRILACKDVADAAMALETLDPKRVFTAFEEPRHRPLFFMFPGQGAQYVNMGRGVYEGESLFRATVDHSVALLESLMGFDLLDILYPDPGREAAATERLNQTAVAQPALFVIEYALAKLWQAWGLKPHGMIGHSIGEVVAACLAGVFTLENALKLIVQRGQLIQQLPGGLMLSAPLAEAEIQPFLSDQLSLAAVNGPRLCTVSGSDSAIDTLQAQLKSQGVNYRRLDTSHAFHSATVEPILDEFAACVERAAPNPPHIPFVSNVTGAWITAGEATDPRYWAKHLRQTVRFADGLRMLLAEEDQVLLEVGPNRTLSTLARQQQAQAAFTSLPHPLDRRADYPFLLTTLGRLWLSSIKIDWRAVYGDERRRRVSLPTYPFARDRYWIEPPERTDEIRARHQSLDKKPDIADWFYTPSWKRSTLPDFFELGDWVEQKSCWLVFRDECELGSQLAKRLEQTDQDVITVMVGKEFRRVSEGAYTLNPRRRDDYDALISELGEIDKHPQIIVHLWNVTPPDHAQSGFELFERAQDLGFYSLLFLAQALGSGKQQVADSLHIGVVSNNLQEVIGGEMLRPEKATLLGPCRVIPQEYSSITCCSIDIVVPESGTRQEEELIERLIEELAARPPDTVVAYRGKHRWVQAFEPVRLDDTKGQRLLRKRGIYLITGGLGGIGLVLAEYLAQTVQAKLVLTGRSAFPARDEWKRWLATHDDQDSTSRKIKKLQALEELGAEILVLSADVTNQEQMQAAVAQAYERLGTIHGVIHTAGVAGGGMIQLKTPETAAGVWAPKVKGTFVLDAIFRDTELDFLVLFSSLTSILGDFGQVDYCAANAFLDAFAHRNASRHAPFTISVNWDAWQEVGMAVDTAMPLEFQQWRQEGIKQGILPKEGVDVLGRILSRRLRQVLVSTRDLHALLEQRKVLAASNLLEELEKARPSQPTYPRPALGNAYVAPTNEIEQTIAGIWQDLFSVEQVGVHDNFFDLGGHSLLLVQMQSKLQADFGHDITVVQLFEHPTIHDLAEYLSQPQTEKPTFVHIEERGQKYRAALKRQRQQKRRHVP